MADLTYSTRSGFGSFALEYLGFNQAVRVDNRIELSGQGGWHTDYDPKVHEELFVSDDIVEQINQAFHNVDVALKFAGGQGWNQVYSVKTYMAPMSKRAVEAVTSNFHKWMPHHKPIWTALGVDKLGEGEDGKMKFEMDVIAYDPK